MRRILPLLLAAMLLPGLALSEIKPCADVQGCACSVVDCKCTINGKAGTEHINTATNVHSCVALMPTAPQNNETKSKTIYPTCAADYTLVSASGPDICTQGTLAPAVPKCKLGVFLKIDAKGDRDVCVKPSKPSAK